MKLQPPTMMAIMHMATEDFLEGKQSPGNLLIKLQERKRELPEDQFAVYRAWAKMLLNSIY